MKLLLELLFCIVLSSACTSHSNRLSAVKKNERPNAYLGHMYPGMKALQDKNTGFDNPFCRLISFPADLVYDIALLPLDLMYKPNSDPSPEQIKTYQENQSKIYIANLIATLKNNEYLKPKKRTIINAILVDWYEQERREKNERRLSAAKKLASIEKAKLLEHSEVSELISSIIGNKYERKSIVRYLLQLKYQLSAEDFFEAFSMIQPTSTREVYLEVLLKMRKRAEPAVPSALKLLNDNSVLVRRSSLRLLINTGSKNPKIIPAMISSLKDFELVAIAAQYLKNLRQPKVWKKALPELLIALKVINGADKRNYSSIRTYEKSIYRILVVLGSDAATALPALRDLKILVKNGYRQKTIDETIRSIRESINSTLVN